MEDLTQYKYLFLDRDGVINEERPADYVKNISEFVFIEGVLEALTLLAKRFNYIFIITNQRGVGKGLMNLSQLENIHSYMQSEIEKNGGKITNIYFCTDLSSTSINRKPNVGMAFQVQRDYPEVDFSKSVMVGNSISDIQFGNKLNMFTVLVGDKYIKDHKIYEETNANYENLYKFTLDFTK